MPEWAEVSLMTENFNRIVNDNLVVNVQKSPTSKVNFSLTESEPLPARVQAYSRGKECKLSFEHKANGSFDFWNILVNFGMSGSWAKSDVQWQRNSRLSLELSDGTYVEFVDPRKFGRFQITKQVGSWGPNRGPDPVNEFHRFSENLNLNKGHRDFRKPLCEVLLNQKWFNGVGNYLRSTIIFDCHDLNPFVPFQEISSQDLYRIALQTKRWCKKAHELGGAELYTWSNPNERSLRLKDVIYYKKGLNCTDSLKRTFWFDPKWRQACPYTINETHEHNIY